MEDVSRAWALHLQIMFYEFPEDQHCWELGDQYMFGDRYLMASVLEAGITKRQVYLPATTWKDLAEGKEYVGGQVLTCETPIEWIPVFERVK